MAPVELDEDGLRSTAATAMRATEIRPPASMGPEKRCCWRFATTKEYFPVGFHNNFRVTPLSRPRELGWNCDNFIVVVPIRYIESSSKGGDGTERGGGRRFGGREGASGAEEEDEADSKFDVLQLYVLHASLIILVPVCIYVHKQ